MSYRVAAGLARVWLISGAAGYGHQVHISMTLLSSREQLVATSVLNQRLHGTRFF